MIYNVAGLTFKLSGGNEYLKVRMADYALNEHSQSCDFFVNVSYSEEMCLPSGKTVLFDACWKCLQKDEGGLLLYRYLEKYNMVTTMADFRENKTELVLLGNDEINARLLFYGRYFLTLLLTA